MMNEAIFDAVPGGPEAQAGQPLNERDFEIFYRTWSKPLMSYLTRSLRDTAAAEEIFQKTMFQFIRSPLVGRQESEMKAYLYRIATNLMIDQWRRVSREKESMLTRWMPSRKQASADGRMDVQRLLQKLKPQERALLWLAHVEGCDHREIAGILAVQEGSVRVLLFRARKKFEAMLTSHGLGMEVLQ